MHFRDSLQSRGLLFVCLVGLLTLVLAVTCNRTTAEQESQEEPSLDTAVFEKRDDAIRQLIGHTNAILKQLEDLDDGERNAVAALLVTSKAVGTYETFSFNREEEILNSYYRELSSFSDVFARSSDVKVFMAACFDQTIDCLSAQKECEDDENQRDCEHSPKVIGACGAEASCIVNEFLKIERGVPDILGGREPWPPLPRPY